MHKLFTDGGSRGNPGNAAVGILLFDEANALIDFDGSFVGVQTNNYAEYQGLIKGLKLAIKHKVQEIVCHLDSELIVKQMNGEYKVKNENIKPLYQEVKKQAEKLSVVQFVHIPRKENKFADKMVNVILDTVEN